MSEKVFNKVLAANRGEIAVRIFRACYDLGIHTVAMYSKEDELSMFRTRADEAYLVGENKSPLGAYLDIPEIIDLAKRRGVDAIHPGYGFLSENADFARACEAAGITFIGPPSDVLGKMGDKLSAKQIAMECGVPVIPGCSEPLRDGQEALEKAISFGFPVILKAAAGGGGRGMRLCEMPEDVIPAFELVKSEARKAFGNDDIFIEKYLVQPKHIEVQILADQYGNVRHLGERDCSLQRRNQKLVEEAPAPFLSEEIVSTLEEYSRRLFTTVGYVGLGTCEFMVTPNGKVYFLEVNPRLQVEHTVSEEVSGLDLVREQLNIAAGGELTRAPELRGHSFELRITSEDPATNLTPGSGTLEKIQWPAGPGVRIDTGVEQGDTISPKFDSMMGKVIVTAQNRLDAVARVRRVLDELVIEGVPTPIPLFKEIFRNDDFTAEHGHPFAVSTKWLERTYLNRTPASAASGQPASLAAAPGAAAPAAPDKSKSETFVIEMNNRRVKLTVPLDIVENITGSARARGAKRPTQPLRGAGLHNVASSAAAANDGAKSGVIASPMQAVVTRINVSEGQQVAKGDLLVVLESMKMENYVYAPAAGEVKKIFVGPADGVEAGDTLVTLDVNAGKAKAAAAAPGSLPQAAASTAPSSEGADKAADAKKEGGND